MKSTLRLALLAFTVCFVSVPARADVPPPETTACQGKQPSEACTFNGVAGTCQNQTCTSRYSGDYACVLCVSTKPAGVDGGDSPSKDNGACFIGRQSAAKRVAPWFLAAAFSSLFLIGRRRRR